MATIPVPAIVVGLNDARLFPSDDELERQRADAREKQLPPSRPVLYTTVTNDPDQYHGCRGKCDFADCECLYFAGKEGNCLVCKHANLYHQTKIRRIDLENKQKADAIKNAKHRRHIVTEKEILEAKAVEENKPAEIVNTYPCDVTDCECKRMAQPHGWDSTSLLPKICRNCKHAEMYHIKRKKEKKNARSGMKTKGAKSKTSKGKSSAASTARTARSQTGKGKKK